MVENYRNRKSGDRPNSRQKNQALFPRKAASYLAAGFELPAIILGGPLVGYFLDNYFDTSPWLLLMVGLFAFVGAFVRLLQWVKFFASERHGSGREKNRNAR